MKNLYDKKIFLNYTDDKIPLNPNTLKAARINDSTTFDNYDTALSNVNKVSVCGIGVVLGNQLCCIDLDGVRNPHTGEILQVAEEIIEKMQSYTEISKSGTGFHIFYYSDRVYKKNKKHFNKDLLNSWDTVIKNKKPCEPEIEMYQKDRYIAMTEDVYKYDEIKRRSEVAETIYNDYIGSDNSISSDTHNELLQGFTGVENIDSKELLTEVQTVLVHLGSNDKFQKLKNGDMSDYDNDKSKCDIALCGMIAKYTNDPYVIDYIYQDSMYFKMSPDRAEKWTVRKDYRLRTLSKVLKDKKLKENEKYIITNENGKRSVDTALLTQYIKEKYSIRTYKKEFRLLENCYCKKIDDLRSMIYEILPIDLKNYKICETVYQNLLLDNSITIKDSDIVNDKYICFKNGILDIKNRKLIDFDEEMIFINRVPYNYNSQAEKCDLTEQFFNNMSNNDDEKKLLLQIIGVAMSDIRTMKNWIYLYGQKDTGKSAYLQIIRNLMTDPDTLERVYSSVSLKQITEEKPFDLFPILSSKVNICAETPAIAIKDDTMLKALTGGGDEISIPIKNKEPVNGISKALLLFAGNTVPKTWVNGDKSALTDRLILFKLSKPVPYEKQIPQIDKKINMEYLILLAIEELYNFIDNNLQFELPESILKARQKVLEDSDLVYSYFKNSIKKGEDKISWGTIYLFYQMYSVMNDETDSLLDVKPSQRTFVKQIKQFAENECYTIETSGNKMYHYITENSYLSSQEEIGYCELSNLFMNNVNLIETEQRTRGLSIDFDYLRKSVEHDGNIKKD